MTEQLFVVMQDIVYLIDCVSMEKKADISRLKCQLNTIYNFAKLNSLSALIAYAFEDALKYSDRDKSAIVAFEEEKNIAMRNMVLFELERNCLVDFLKKNDIFHMILKGVHISDLYPKPFMRQVADNDIWFDKSYENQVVSWFKDRGYTCKMNAPVHYEFTKEPVLNFEMHHTSLFSKSGYDVFYEYYNEKLQSLVLNSKDFQLNFSDEDFYVYIICHSYKHYTEAGTGFRTLVDLFFLNKKLSEKLNRDYIDSQLKKLGIYDFEQSLQEICKAVFLKKSLDEKNKKMLLYILNAGTYGDRVTNMSNKIKRVTGGKVNAFTKAKYILSRVFPKPEIIKERYGKIGIVLLPVFYLIRILQCIFKGFSKGLNEIRWILKAKQ
ncbi:MAG: nucleotidyltransferase family protein [Clostridia bacterium]|nr:nucleotidyltransferase family protein [Clostridia bacterium]